MFRNDTKLNTFIYSHRGLLTGVFTYFILDVFQTAEIHPDCIIVTPKYIVGTLI